MCHPNIMRKDALSERLFQSTIHTLELFGVYIGKTLGLYRELAQSPRTSSELAVVARIDERYAREWLEQQAVSSYLFVDDVSKPALERKYTLPPAYAAVLADADDPAHVAPFAQMVVGIAGALPRVIEAYRSGTGVPYAEYGPDFRAGQGGINRPAFSRDLLDSWLTALPDINQRLEHGEALHIADVGCGEGWACIALAKAYPNARVVGFDLDSASIDAAKANAKNAGVQVEFVCADATEISDGGRFDLILLLETLHDLARPVLVLRALRKLLAAHAVLLIADERVAEAFTTPGDEIERMMYGWSISHCLPASRAEPQSAAIGTAIRPHVVSDLARAAEFTQCQLLDVQNDLFRFWRLQ